MSVGALSSLEDSQQRAIRAFRAVASEARRELGRPPSGGRRKLRVVDGYIEAEGWIEEFRRLCVPVRRACLAKDRANFVLACTIVERAVPTALRPQVEAVARRHAALTAELSSAVALAGRRVTQQEMFQAWLDAAVFYDSQDKRRAYEELVESLGKAVEGIAADITRQMAACIVELDDVIGAWLGESPSGGDPGDPGSRP